MKCKCPQQTGSMVLVRFDTEKQLEAPPHRPLLCPLSHILELCQALLAFNALLFVFFTRFLCSHMPEPKADPGKLKLVSHLNFNPP